MTRALWRSFLFVPADNERLLASAVGKPADVVILDLEDGTHPSRKKLARQMCEMRAGGATCQDIAVRFGQSVHMAYYYTQPKRMREFGFAVEQAAAEPAVGAHWGGLVQ